MIRRLFTAASVVSLLLCLLATAMWIRSYCVWETFSRDFSTPPHFDPDALAPAIPYSIDAHTKTVIYSFDGSLDLWRWVFLHEGSDGSPILNKGWERQADSPDRTGGSTSWKNLWRFAFSYYHDSRGSTLRVCTPLCAASVLLSFLPSVWLVRWRIRRSRSVSGFCPACGYDLRASKGRCPECGAPINSIAGTKA